MDGCGLVDAARDERRGDEAGRPSSRSRRTTDAGSAALMLNWADMALIPNMREFE